ncbi:MAG TPA: cation:proton antiporter [Mariprofundaceae bacterium]|nr:cation:proton antiporter [Mariprofundaceae bacterium]
MLPLSESILVLMALLALAMIAAPLTRRLPIPFTVVLVGFGMGLGWASQFWEPLHLLQHFRLTPDLVLFVFLPVLIFESGYNLDARQLIKDIFPVLVLAVPALLLSTLLIGTGLYLIFSMQLGLALLFGALISATDPVAVISLFKELGAPLRLTVLVEGESLFNDATAIVVFHILLGLALAGGSLGIGTLGHAGVEFLYVFFGGALLGLACGLVFCEWMRLLRDNFSGILVLSVILAYVSFIIAEHFLHISGVMAVVGASLCLGVYGVTRISHHAGEGLRESWEGFAYVCNSLLFMLVGLSVDLNSLAAHLPYIAAAIALVLLSRMPAVYWLLPFTLRRFRLPAVRKGDKHIMWWGGLKGGLAIAIVLSLPEDLAGRQLLLDMTLGVVIFTLLINAPTIKPLMARLGLNKLNADERAELEQGILHAREHANLVLQRMEKAHFMTRAGLMQANQLIGNVMRDPHIAISPEQQLSHVRQIATRAELEELERLRDAGMVPQYVLLDIKSELRLERESTKGDAAGANPILRFEQGLLGWLRERDWMAGWLSRYQGLRISGRLRRTILRILMTDAAIEHLKARKDIDEDARKLILDELKVQLKSLHAQIAEVHANFPGFFARFETRMGMQAALAGAGWQADDDQSHGEIGQKAHHRIQQMIFAASDKLPEINDAPLTLPAKDLIRMVPMFSSLSEKAAEVLGNQAAVVTFLPGDTVIEEDAKGDALYIISQGAVVVSHMESMHDSVILTELRVGDFFGEMALLGDQVRRATVIAKQPSTLLRLARKDVLTLASEYPEVEQRLKEAEEARKQELG